MSRMPNSDMCKVRGIGVAVIVSTSTVWRTALSRSFTSTPKRCSSSMITSPRLCITMSCCASRCVPITTSIEPSARPANISRVSLVVQNRDSEAMVMGNSAILALKVLACCSARIVVGTSTATWWPLSTTLNAARMASSVLPKPTSPQSRRSMGRGCCMSDLMAPMAVNWSGVSR